LTTGVQPLPSRRRGPLIALVLVVVAVLVAVVLVVVLTSRDSGPRPVVLVYGYMGTTDQLEPLATALRATDRDVTVADLPDHNTGDLRDSAEALGKVVDQVLARTGAGSVDIVAHSAGGIVTRLWVAGGGAETTRRVVTLGSPHHGSNGADVFPECLEACQELTPGSDFLAELDKQDETPGSAQWISLYSENDGAVVPPESSRLDGALDLALQDVCEGAEINHSQLLSDPLPINMVVAELDADEPITFGPQDCARLSG